MKAEIKEVLVDLREEVWPDQCPLSGPTAVSEQEMAT